MLDTPRTIATLKARLVTATGQTLDVAFEAAPAGTPGPSAAGILPASSPRNAPAPPASAPPAAGSDAPDVAAPPAPAPATTKPRVPAPATSNGSGAPVLLSKDEFLNDPAIRMALDVFKGQIVEVRAPEA